MGRKKLDIDFDTASKAYDEGKTLKEVAEAAGCSTATISNLFKKHGKSRRSRGRPRVTDITVPTQTFKASQTTPVVGVPSPDTIVT